MLDFEQMLRKYCIQHPGTGLDSAVRTLLKQEAKNRMQIMRLHPNVIGDFMQRDVLNRSEADEGGLCCLTMEEEQMVKNWESENRHLVYHVLKNKLSNTGQVYSLFYVSGETSEWNSARESLRDGWPLVYGMNITYPFFSEFGIIRIESRYGRIIRLE